MSVKLFSGNNTHTVEMVGLTNDSDGSLINDATVTCSVYEYDGDTLVSGETWPVSMTASGADGIYSGNFNANTGIDAGSRYVIKLSVTSGTNRAEFERSIMAEKRRF